MAPRPGIGIGIGIGRFRWPRHWLVPMYAVLPLAGLLAFGLVAWFMQSDSGDAVLPKTERFDASFRLPGGLQEMCQSAELSVRWKSADETRRVHLGCVAWHTRQSDIRLRWRESSTGAVLFYDEPWPQVIVAVFSSDGTRAWPEDERDWARAQLANESVSGCSLLGDVSNYPGHIHR